MGPLPGDRWSLRFTQWPPRPQPWRDLGELFSLLGTPLLAVLTVVPAVLLVARGLGARAGLFVAASSAVVVPNAALKHLLGPTPLWSSLHEAAGHNYPSGHVAYAVGLAGALGWLAWDHGRRDLVAIAAFFVVLMGPMRVATGAHLPSDVVAGYLVGAGWVVAVRAVVGGRGPRSG